MFSSSKQTNTLFASSARVLQKNAPHISEIPSRIDSKSEYWKVDERTNLPVDEVYNFSKRFVLNFEDMTGELVKSLDKSSLREAEKNFSCLTDKAEEIEKGAEYKLKVMEFEKEYFLEEIKNPSVLFSAYKHCMLAKKAFGKIQENSEKVKGDFQELREKENFEEVKMENIDFIRAGMFLAAEPILVFSIFQADTRRDLDFTTEYIDLVNDVAFTISRSDPDFYRDAVNLRRDKFKEGTLENLMEGKKEFRSRVL